MKFGKQLRQIVLGSLPEWQPKFIAYKALKQRIEPRQDLNGSGDAKVRTKAIQPVVIKATMSSEESKMLESKGVKGQGKVFFEVLRNEMDKVNEFYLDKEEDCIIRYDLLASKVKDFVSIDNLPATLHLIVEDFLAERWELPRVSEYLRP